MVESLRKYRAVFIALALLLFVVLAWIIYLRQNTAKIPSRGVFVTEDIIGGIYGKNIYKKAIPAVC